MRPRTLVIKYRAWEYPVSDGSIFNMRPDENHRQAGLRLDLRQGAIAELESGATAIVPGQPQRSELVRRVRADGDATMPPADSGKRLSERQKQLLEDWISQGAAYAEHWSFVTPRRPVVPAAARPDWARSAIDRFILAQGGAKDAAPAPEASRATPVIRRTIVVSFAMMFLRMNCNYDSRKIDFGLRD